MTWNYRIVKTDEGYSIYEVFYDDKGKAIATTKNPTLDFHVESVDGIKEELEIIKEAFNKSPLNMDEIGENT